MSTELILIIAAAVLIVTGGVYFYFGHAVSGNKQPKIEPIMPGPKQQPSDDPAPAPDPVPADPVRPDEGQEEQNAQQPPVFPHFLQNETEPTETPDIDQMIEIVVTLQGRTPFEANRAVLACSALKQNFGTPLRVQAKNQITRLWEGIRRNSTYTDMVVTLQLATRTDTVDEVTAGRFAAAVNQAADTIDADANVVDVPNAALQAKQLRGLIDWAGQSKQIGVKTPVPLSTQALLPFIRSSGLTIEEDNSVVKKTADGGSWIRMMPHPTDRCIVLFDFTPALCPSLQNPLGEVFALANSLAARSGGEITGPSGVRVSSADIVHLSRQVKLFCSEMARHGLEPGSRRVRRLLQSTPARAEKTPASAY